VYDADAPLGPKLEFTTSFGPTLIFDIHHAGGAADFILDFFLNPVEPFEGTNFESHDRSTLLSFEQQGSVYCLRAACAEDPGVFGRGTWLVCSSASDMLAALTQLVFEVNVHAGIANSLDTKLQNAIAAVDQSARGDTASAFQMVSAFVNAVEAQRGNKLTAAQADALKDSAMNTLACLEP
jgi:hypothetical protein